MRLGPTISLTRFLGVFFCRRVLQAGPLRTKAARITAALLLLVFYLLCVAVSYSFLKSDANDERTWRLIFGVATVSVLLWTIAAFLLVKTLFLSADGVLRLTYQLPLTNKERAAALLLFESATVLGVATVGFLSLATVSVILVGPSALGDILAAFVLPATITYLVLALGYVILERLFMAIGLERIRKPLLVLAIFAVLLLYARQMTSLTVEAVSGTQESPEAFVWTSTLIYLQAKHGVPLMLAAAAVAIVILAFTALLLVPSRYIPSSRYVRIPLGSLAQKPVGAYLACWVRSIQTWLVAAVALALFGFLAASGGVNPLWSIAILSMGGFYLYANTEALRAGKSGNLSGPWRLYAHLVGSQLIATTAFVLAAVVVLIAARGVEKGSTPSALLGIASSIIIATLVGVVFPAQDDNPFSVLVGALLVGLTLGTLVISLGILRVPPVMVGVALLLSHLVFIWYTVLAISSAQSRRRFAQVHNAP